MLNSKEELISCARSGGYKPEILEKVYWLLDVFQQIMTVPFLKERLVLKGGTALNLFCFEQVPRLSVDIDLNYIGALDRERMLYEKPQILEAIYQILLQNNFERYRAPMYHAGGKMVWLYSSLLGQRGSLEIDINFMYRQPLFPISLKTPTMEGYRDFYGPILDVHELAAGKLSALFDRKVSRDWFDAHYLLTNASLNIQKLQIAFVIYLAMTKIDLSSVKPETINFDLTDLKHRLQPLMSQLAIPRKAQDLIDWATIRISELRQGLSRLLPLEENQMLFIKKIREEGVILPELITSDKTLSEKIIFHPAINWAMKQR